MEARDIAATAQVVQLGGGEVNCLAVTRGVAILRR
jgi:hypothetical protein